MKKLFVCLCAFALIISTDVLKANTMMKVVDHKGAAYGIDTPEWLKAFLQGGNSTVEALELYKERKVKIFADTFHGVSLKDTQRRANTVSINSQVAQAASTAIIQVAIELYASASASKATGQSNKSKEAVVTSDAFADVVIQASRSSFRGLVKDADWWVLKSDGRRERYEYTVLYYMNKELFDKQIQGIITEAIQYIESETGDNTVAEQMPNILDLVKGSVDTVYEAQTSEDE